VLKRLLRLARRSARPIVSIGLSVLFLSATAGVPIAVRAPKDRSGPFPCQDNPCGCLCPEQCWRHCCCHTNREKVEWARAHGITPPDFVIAAAQKEEKEEKESRKSGHACCRHGHCPHCAAAKADDDDDDAPAAPSANKLQASDSSRMTLVITDLARRCAGLPLVWTVLSAALPVRISPTWSFDFRVVGIVIELPSSTPAVELSPPVPPPKLSSNLCG
jgi:hypothetical protein